MEDDPPEPAGQSSANGSASVISQIERLAALKDKGHISNEEYAAQKAGVLAAPLTVTPADLGRRPEGRKSSTVLGVGMIVVALAAVGGGGFAAWSLSGVGRFAQTQPKSSLPQISSTIGQVATPSLSGLQIGMGRPI